ncbi:MAG TPA: heptaprenyl diphosphate synthase component 1 [Savagea sp.]
MNLVQLNEEVDLHLERVTHALYDASIRRELGVPPVDRSYMLLTILPKLVGDEWTEEQDRVALAIQAIRAAFVAHDEVTVKGALDQRGQLTVLAGDHYSGIHYRLLANVPSYRFIRTLSQSIASVNEKKMTLYFDRPSTADEWLHAIQSIELLNVNELYRTFKEEETYRKVASLAYPLHLLRSEEPVLYRDQIAVDSLNELEQRLTAQLSTLLKTLDWPQSVKRQLVER